MVTLIRFPKIDANIETATVTAWLKREGEAVAPGDVLAEITTDKGVVEFEATAAGTLRRITAPEGSMVPVGYVLALIGDPADALPDVAAENAGILRRHRESLTVAAAPLPVAAPPGGRVVVRATPAARRVAREKGLDLAQVQKATGADLVTEKTLDEFLATRAGG
ncbi:MAG: Dihydrolipoyllysine-residue succinyltransferase component of 2-oxoglutarate dehydrogenase complex [Lentisphaerae bacterium ADurb.BinA184]|nr:MAG: Dihydrolipoyllysine-residue succinyltransferase component of 2-oxoglutarate dehydrogenase complex [Lentisphaerae bacterium ADurb.BinA184]